MFVVSMVPLMRSERRNLIPHFRFKHLQKPGERQAGLLLSPLIVLAAGVLLRCKALYKLPAGTARTLSSP